MEGGGILPILSTLFPSVHNKGEIVIEHIMGRTAVRGGFSGN